MWADLAGYSKMRSTTAACGVPVVLGKLWSDIPARQTSSASVTSGGLPGPDRPVPSEGMMRAGQLDMECGQESVQVGDHGRPQGQTCVNTPILDILRLSVRDQGGRGTP